SEERLDLLAGHAIEDLDVRPAAGARPGDDVGQAVAGDVAGRHGDAAAEAGPVGKVAFQQRAVLAAKDLDVRPAAGARPGDDVSEAVAIDVADGHVDAA